MNVKANKVPALIKLANVFSGIKPAKIDSTTTATINALTGKREPEEILPNGFGSNPSRPNE